MTGEESTNTTALIGAWSMRGARSDLGGRFGSAVDIHAAMSERDDAHCVPDEPMTAAPSPLLVKATDDADWQPLSPARDAA